MNEDLVEQWLELHSLVEKMEQDIEKQDYFKIEGDDFRILQEIHETLKHSLNIKTGSKEVESLTTKEIFFVNIWQEFEDGHIVALSKRRVNKK